MFIPIHPLKNALRVFGLMFRSVDIDWSFLQGAMNCWSSPFHVVRIVIGFRQTNQDDASAKAISTDVGDLKWEISNEITPPRLDAPTSVGLKTHTLPNAEKKTQGQQPAGRLSDFQLENANERFAHCWKKWLRLWAYNQKYLQVTRLAN